MISSNAFKDFFNMFMIPTLILDNNLNTMFSYKYDSNIQNSFFTSKVINLLNKSKFITGVIPIKLNDNIEYTIIQFYHYDNMPMYILIGPYIIKDTSLNEHIIKDILVITQDTLENVIKIYTSFIINKSCIHNKLNIASSKSNSPCINRAIEYIKENYANYISIDELCAELNINKCYFCSMFKKETGFTFINYLNSYKIEKSKELLKNTNLSLLDIAIAVGFNNQSYYSTVFKKITSKTPIEFRENLINP